jgi:dihydrodipicolinate synthase/N-acetylneuraminate lyase
MLTAQDIRGLYAIMPTPATPDADRVEATNTVNLDETARLTEAMIQDGVAGFMALGTTGECATLTEDEFRAFADCLLATVNKRVPVFIGATALGTHDVARRIRFLRDRGADGTLLGMPMWQPCVLPIAVQYYESLSQAFPDFAIMVYANPRAFRYEFPPEFWKQIVQRAPTVIAAKFAMLGTYPKVLRVAGDRINFLPVDHTAYNFARIAPDKMTACWTTAAGMGPAPSVALMDALLAHDWERAKQISDEINWAVEPSEVVLGNQTVFASYNIQIHKYEMETAGYCTPGPARPPYNYMPEQYAEAGRETGRRWAQIRAKYARAAAPAATTD